MIDFSRKNKYFYIKNLYKNIKLCVIIFMIGRCNYIYEESIIISIYANIFSGLW